MLETVHGLEIPDFDRLIRSSDWRMKVYGWVGQKAVGEEFRPEQFARHTNASSSVNLYFQELALYQLISRETSGNGRAYPYTKSGNVLWLPLAGALVAADVDGVIIPEIENIDFIRGLADLRRTG